jgi:glutamate--cysteine ligase
VKSHTPVRREELSEVFRAHEKPTSEFRIGAENEKFGVHEQTGAPLNYDGAFGVCRIFSHLTAEHGWEPIVETPDGPVLGLSRGRANITLEPSAQFELSGEPLSNLHEVRDEQAAHLREIAPISTTMNIAWLGTGFHPIAHLKDLPWVPKQRYPIMREYLPQKGSGGLDMMQRTATVQGNFDWQSEEDALRKVRVALRMSPLVHAWFSNAPFSEGRVHGALSRRGDVWRHMDPSRSGLIRPLWDESNSSYDDYVEWSLDAGMFLFWRDGVAYKNTGQTFRDFLNHGHAGHKATLADYKLHLTTLFPEVRLKNTIEVRAIDSLPPDLALGSLAVWTGILYDPDALVAAHELLGRLSYDEVESARPALVQRGLHAELGGQSGFVWAEKLLSYAEAGLRRREQKNAQGEDESVYLSGVAEILNSRLLPAERALERFRETGSLIEATRIDLPGSSV